MKELQAWLIFAALTAISFGIGAVSRSIDRQTSIMLCIAAAENGVLCEKAKP